MFISRLLHSCICVCINTHKCDMHVHVCISVCVVYKCISVCVVYKYVYCFFFFSQGLALLLRLALTFDPAALASQVHVLPNTAMQFAFHVNSITLC